MFALLGLIIEVIRIYEMIIIAYVVLSWLVSLGIVDRYNRIVVTVGDVLARLAEPALQPVKRLLDRMGLGMSGIDFSPFIVILLLQYLPLFLEEMLLPATPYIR